MRLRTAVTSLAASAAVVAGGVLAASPASAGALVCTPSGCPPVQSACQTTSFALFAIDPTAEYCWNALGSTSVGIGGVVDLDSGAYSGYIVANGQVISFGYHETVSLPDVKVTDVTLLSMD